MHLGVAGSGCVPPSWLLKPDWSHRNCLSLATQGILAGPANRDLGDAPKPGHMASVKLKANQYCSLTESPETSYWWSTAKSQELATRLIHSSLAVWSWQS